MGVIFSLVISPDSAKKVYNLRRERRLAGEEACPEQEDRRVHADGGLHQIANPKSCYRQKLSNWAWVSLLILVTSVLVNVPMLTFANYRTLVDPPDELWAEPCRGRSLRILEQQGVRAWWACIPSWQGYTMVTMMLFEMGGLVVLLFFLMRSVYYVNFRESGYTKWHHMDALWCDHLPLLGRFSAIKFLGKAHPAFLMLEFRRGINHVLEDAEELLEEAEDHPMDTKLVEWTVRAWIVFKLSAAVVYAVGMRLVVFVCGFAAFLTKVRVVQDEFTKPKHEQLLGVPYLWGVFLAVAFLNQALNMIDVSRRLFDRSLRFVFAGEDALFQKHEWNLRLCYKAEVAETLFQVFAVEQGRPMFAAAAIVAFDHLDVQRLAFAYVGLEGKNKRPDHLKAEGHFVPKHLLPQYLQDCEEVGDAAPETEQLLDGARPRCSSAPV